MSVAFSQPDNKALKDKQKWWRKQSCDCELLHHHPPFMASVLQSSVSLTNCADCQGPPCWTFPLPASVSSSTWITPVGKDLRKQSIMIQNFSQLLFYWFMDKTVSHIFIYSCTWIFPACLWHIYSWHRESPQAVCNGKVLQCQKSRSKPSITMSGLGYSKSMTMKDKAVSTCSVPRLCLSLDSQTPLSCPGVWVRHKFFLTAFKLQFRAISVRTDSRLQIYCRPQMYNIL